MNKFPLLSDIMVTNVITVDLSDDLRTLSRVFNNFDYDCVPVVKNRKLKGVVQREDYNNLSRRLSRKAARQSEAVLANVQVQALMTNNIIKLATYNTLADAIEIFEMGLFPTIPIVNRNNELVGIINHSDMLNHQSDLASPTGSGRMWQ